MNVRIYICDQYIRIFEYIRHTLLQNPSLVTVILLCFVKCQLQHWLAAPYPNGARCRAAYMVRSIVFAIGLGNNGTRGWAVSWQRAAQMRLDSRGMDGRGT